MTTPNWEDPQAGELQRRDSDTSPAPTGPKAVPLDGDDPVARLLALLPGATRRGDEWTARCPAHDDSTPSLSVACGSEGKALLLCRAGCTTDSVLAALGLQPRDLFPREGSLAPRPRQKVGNSRSTKRHRTLVDAVAAAHWSATNKKRDGRVNYYVFHDASGEAAAAIVRIDFDDGRAKEIRQVHRDGDAWICKAQPSPRLLYRLPELLAADPTEPLLVVEGEKCAESVAKLGGFVVTTPQQGAKSPRLSDYSPMHGRQRIVVVLDNDDAGRSFGNVVASLAYAAGAASVALLDFDGLAKGEDVHDWIVQRQAAGKPDAEIAAELRELVAAAVPVPETAQEEEPEQRASSAEGIVRLGERDPVTGRVVLSPRRTLPTALACVREHYSHPDGPTLQCYAGLLMRWIGNRYVEVEEGQVRQMLHGWMHEALRYAMNKKTGEPELVPFEANPGTVKSALETLRAHTFIAADTPKPAWLAAAPGDIDPAELLPCRTMTLHIPSGRVLPPTPRLFNVNALTFDHDPKAKLRYPLWDAFLDQLFGEDDDQRYLLQEWFGYALTADTSQQKILLIVGPRRSGKGTIARVLTNLVGAGNVCNPTVSSLAGPFGLQLLLGKTLAIVSDARFAGEGVATVVERLLCVSGEDAVSVDRKHTTAVTMKLPTRFVFLTNELPCFSDASTALAGRFTVLRLEHEWYGKEDIDLTQKLLTELPGILCWALEGWQRLRTNRRFTSPESTRTAMREIEDISSPVQAFVREQCTVGAERRVPVDDLYAAWHRWCTAEGRTVTTTKSIFGRNLSAAMPGVRKRRTQLGASFYDGIALNNGGGA